MITFKQFLAESQNYPLYHATTLYRAVEILDRGGFEGRTTQRLNKTDTAYSKGLSTTRNYKFAIRWATNLDDAFVIFHLDREKIRNNYKVVPYNYWWGVTRDKLNNESEEFVILGGKKFLPTNVIKQVDYYTPRHSSVIDKLSSRHPNIKFKSLGGNG